MLLFCATCEGRTTIDADIAAARVFGLHDYSTGTPRIQSKASPYVRAVVEPPGWVMQTFVAGPLCTQTRQPPSVGWLSCLFKRKFEGKATVCRSRGRKYWRL